MVKGSADPLILLAHIAQTRAVCLSQRGRRIGRAIVDDDQLEVAKRLVEHAVDGRAQILFAVVHRQDDADQGTRHTRCSAPQPPSRILTMVSLTVSTRYSGGTFQPRPWAS